jgi:hypothetical protein
MEENREPPAYARLWRDRIRRRWSMVGLWSAARKIRSARAALEEATQLRGRGDGQLLHRLRIEPFSQASSVGAGPGAAVDRAAETYGRQANSVQKMAEAAHYEALTLAALSEYEASQAAVARGRKYADLGVRYVRRYRSRSRKRIWRGDATVRKGSSDFPGDSERHPGQCDRCGSVQILMAKSLAFARQTRPALVEALDCPERINTGEIPPDVGMRLCTPRSLSRPS